MKMKVALFALYIVALTGCTNDSIILSSVQLRLLQYSGLRPVAVFYELNPVDSMELRPNARAHVDFSLSPEDTLHVVIEEFSGPVDAYASWMNRGLGPERVPRINGNVVEQSIWSGRWIFIFSSPPHRLPRLEAMDSLVMSFPESGGGLPPEFLTLPLKQRIPQGASVQKGTLLGREIVADFLCQRYQDEIGPWTIARSLSSVSEGELSKFLVALQATGAQPDGNDSGRTYWIESNFRIVIGRVGAGLLVVWGMRDRPALIERWNEAKRTFQSE